LPPIAARVVGGLALAFALSTAIVAGGCSKSTATAEGKDGKDGKGAGEAKEVTLFTVVAQPVERAVEVTGTLDAFERVTVAAKVPGRIGAMPIDLASRVKSGDVIARVELVDYQLDVQSAAAAVEAQRAQLGLERGKTIAEPTDVPVVLEARATLDQANAALERAQRGKAEGITSTSEVETAEAAAKRAEAALQTAMQEVRLRQATLRERSSGLARAQQALTDTTVVSPIDGVVQARLVDLGEYVAAGAPIAEVVRVDPLRLRIAVPEREAARVRQGQAVRIRIEGDEKVHEAVLTRVAPALDMQSRTVLAEADVKNPEGHLRPGSLVTARVLVDQQRAPLVPTTALVEFAGLTKVVTVKDGKAHEVAVKTGQKVGEMIEIVSGIEVGTKVVAKPGSLRHGQAVRVSGEH
jgi:RND family efflux transporter MFP subunit